MVTNTIIIILIVWIVGAMWLLASVFKTATRLTRQKLIDWTVAAFMWPVYWPQALYFRLMLKRNGIVISDYCVYMYQENDGLVTTNHYFLKRDVNNISKHGFHGDGSCRCGAVMVLGMWFHKGLNGKYK